MNWQFPKLRKSKAPAPQPLSVSCQQGQQKIWVGLLPLIPGLVSSLILGGICRLGLCYPLEQIANQAFFHLRGPIPIDERVVIIGIDEASLKTIGRFPWSRLQYAKLLNLLAEAEPNVVAIDLLFPESTPEDQGFAEAIATHGQVILAESWRGEEYLQPVPRLRNAAIGTGHVLKIEQSDGISRQLLPQYRGTPAFSAIALQVYNLVSESVPPPNLTQTLDLNWLGPARRIPQYSFVQVLNGQIPPETFANKIVLVGVTAANFDPLITPFDRNPPATGVYLHATAIDNFLQQRFFKVIPSQWVFMGLLGVAPVLSWLLTRAIKRKDSVPRVSTDPAFSLLLIAFLGLPVGWVGLSFVLFELNYQIPVTIPVLSFVLTVGAVAIADRFEMTARLQESEQRYALAVQGSNEGLWDWNLITDEIYFSPRWKSMLGIAEAVPLEIPAHWWERVHPEDRIRLKSEVVVHLQNLTPYFESEYRILHTEGHYRWMLSRGLAVRDSTGRAYRMAGSQTDITERKLAEERLRYSAFHDPLTDLPNRALLIHRLQQVIYESQQQPESLFAVLFLDLDRFKTINDSLGHLAGDQLLVQLAQRLWGCLGEQPGLVARLGGDEFTIVLEQLSQAHEAEVFAVALQQTITQPFYLGSHQVFTSASIGITLSSIGYEKPEDLLRDADTAMFRAKATGKAKFEIFDTAMHAQVLAQLQLETDLRRAIEQQEFLVYYQPIVCLKTLAIAGFEALVRWNHPKLGLVSPGRFIPLAEETGLIHDLSWWVLAQSCRQLKDWQFKYPHLPLLKMSVNLSGVQFEQPNLIERIAETLARTGLEGRYLKLEITEGTIGVHAKLAIALLQQIRALGIELSIDDFGTGYSSLGRLRHLPIHTLKIDRSFVSAIASDQDSDSCGIIQAILTLAQHLGLDVIAEGIETEQQLHQLRMMGCGYGQGYLFSKPVDADSAEQLLRHLSVNQVFF